MNVSARCPAGRDRPRVGPFRRALRLLALAFTLFAFVLPLTRAAEVIPPAPADHFNDYARLVSPAAARSLDAQLTQFERDTSTQLVVVIYPKRQSDSSIEDYTVRVAQAWGVGRKDRKNGAVLFFFMQEHEIYIQVGYGLEGVLPDATCKRIIEDEIVPRFKAGQFEAGVRAGVTALQAAARGEYKGTGRTVREGPGDNRRDPAGLFLFGLVVFVIIASLSRRRSSTYYGSRGRRTMWWGGGPGSWGGGDGGGWSGGGGGSFSGGGGSFGGGGAGGRW